MNNVNKTLYIPLYGKSYVSKKGIILKDSKAIEIWEKEGFKLKRKSKSKYLAYYMAVRAAVFDEFVKDKVDEDTIVLHIGCGMDSRVLRVNSCSNYWYDIDFPTVIEERKKYYLESKYYKMIGTNINDLNWINNIAKCNKAIVILEGVSMYLIPNELINLIIYLDNHFDNLDILMDCYSDFAAKMSKYKNPINDVGVNKVYGLDDPYSIESDNVKFIKEHIMIPDKYKKELKGFEKFIFSKLYAGSMSKKLYKLYEYKK